MAFELWAADALRMKRALDELHRKRRENDEAAKAEAHRLRGEVAAAKAEDAAGRQQAEAAVASTMGAELAVLESTGRVRAANQMVVVRLAVEHATVHRFWKTWASVASLLLREAGGALLQGALEAAAARRAHSLAGRAFGGGCCRARREPRGSRDAQQGARARAASAWP